ncbi:nucleotide disphospho-sugar-binding domain-containing protein [Saccharopolyspora shandongensis]|uniref:glycosyltransferase n=1 Tax=Saccharopolyspora shandongensis TaxID=418495 RepID=UPI00343D6A3E
MRVLFSTTPQHGHLLPLLPLARAFQKRGDDVAVLTSGTLQPVLEPEELHVLSAGPTAAELMAEVSTRTGVDAAHNPTPEAVGEFFAGARIDLTADEALAAASDFRPDLVVREVCDYVGPLVAAAHAVPMAGLAFGPALPTPFVAAFDATAQPRFAARGLSLPQDTWLLDTCPPSLQADDWQRSMGWQPLRPEPHRAPGAPAPASVASSERKRVLVSFGTYFNTPEIISPLLAELTTSDIDLVVTLGLLATPEQFDVDHSRVSFVPFTPLADLLPGVDAILTHGGAGTTLAALAKGIPLVVIPQGADQFIQAERVAATGAGIALEPGEATPQATAAAVSKVLTDPLIRKTTTALAEQIATMPTPTEVAATLAAAAK